MATAWITGICLRPNRLEWTTLRRAKEVWEIVAQGQEDVPVAEGAAGWIPAAALKAQGATKVVAYCTHAELSGAAIDNITNSALDELVVTDTIPLSQAAKACGKIRQLSVAELLAETIRRIAFGESVSSLYVD